MAKVVLVRLAYSTSVYGVYEKLPKIREVRPPLGLMYVAAALEKAGHEVVIVDGEPKNLNPSEMFWKIMDLKPDFVGLTATTPEFHAILGLAGVIKLYSPETVTIVGGAHVSVRPNESVKHSAIDYVVVDEGERAIVEIVNNRPADPVVKLPLIGNLNDNVLPARHLINYKNYNYPIPGKGMVRMDAIESSRGCPFSCTFCHMRKTSHRLRSPRLVVDEIEKSHKKYGTEFFMFFDDTLTVKKSFVLEICDEIIIRGLHKKVCFYANTRANTTDREMLQKMKDANITEMSTGVESGNDLVLRNIKKGTQKKQYKQVYKWMHEIGLQTRGSFIVGLPHETHKTVMDTINFARELDLMRASCNILTPYPGTIVYDMAIKRDGLIFVDENIDWSKFRRWGNSTIRTPDLTKEDLEHYQKLFLTLFYSQFKVIWYHTKQLLKGNFSYYFYRPVLFAIKNRIKMIFGAKI